MTKTARMEFSPLSPVTSPTDSECNSVTGLIDNGNTGHDVTFSPRTPRIGAINQVVQSLRNGSSRNYSSLGSCPHLPPAPQCRPLLSRTGLVGEGDRPKEDLLDTGKGKMCVAVTGNPTGPALITFHDLALNYLSNFQTFFSTPAMSAVVSRFCIYHVNAPGQEEGARDLSTDAPYPTLDQLSEMVEYVCHNYGISHCICLGVGLGANVLVRLAKRRPRLVDGLILVNCGSQTSGWLDWAYHKINIKSLKKQNSVADSVLEYLSWYHLGNLGGNRSIDVVSLASIYRQHFSQEVNPNNLALLIQSYATRTDLNIAREIAANGKALYGANKTLQMPVLNMVGEHSPHVESTVTFNGRLDPSKCTWMKIRDAGMILEEQDEKVAQALILFLQGLGHPLRKGRSKSVSATPRKMSLPLTNTSTPGPATRQMDNMLINDNNLQIYDPLANDNLEIF